MRVAISIIKSPKKKKKYRISLETIFFQSHKYPFRIAFSFTSYMPYISFCTNPMSTSFWRCRWATLGLLRSVARMTSLGPAGPFCTRYRYTFSVVLFHVSSRDILQSPFKRHAYSIVSKMKPISFAEHLVINVFTFAQHFKLHLVKTEIATGTS